ncbi:MAG TPA: hypothetical protein VI875_04565 [Candidatus Norongarragalinales archaeon]|nr:hypothetical protein [Candidatus Norongarragalinales archaeon]
MRNFLERAIVHEANHRVWSSLAEDEVSHVVHAQFEILRGGLKESLLKQMVSTGLKDLEKQVEDSNEFKRLSGTKLIFTEAEPTASGFLAKLQVHVRK